MPVYLYIPLVALLLLAGYVSVLGIRAGYLIHLSKEIQEQTTSFTKDGVGASVLVLGDSTAFGVGSSPEESVPGRLSLDIDAGRVVNVSKSGATTDDLAGQLSGVLQQEYDIALIQIGGNDIIKFKDLDTAKENLEQALTDVPSSRIVLLTAGDVGNAPFFPWPLSEVYTARTKELRRHFIDVAQKTEQVEYVDLFVLPDVFESDPSRYYAPDRLHLSGDGYAIWYRAVKEVVENRWPEMYGRTGNN